MGRGDSRNSLKMRRLKAQRRLKARIQRRRVAAAAVRAEKKAVAHSSHAAHSGGSVKQREKKGAHH